ncbi:MAG: TIGR02587 family membrane protein [Brasilonema octagenarum HA4186-MV1]|jgi:putative integral membrane protein (TIGR02587 family)|uniref:TIGR02587 family membrane protein n=2 Tax=Brasilonema TaxID=383614 RepID=A0A856M922_9CYAN|nr:MULTISPECIES: TIGR02587 family membrane protein [Brasilonema]MBW4625464.1 TIGR02587 family membrane protein [Brasilonema octagenarum HA4186-MV1]NMF63088.1 TIGR02587 family membrane protein [Brasilonema octagenarum UFV-OR1]QDL07212.1 TIGR02587 family membrane protein [Brasilonema sennae CENA114]QDL13575.1 TIGR02587 family membrane protein [Brasilonema octagenarum UFV-E1]
MSIGRKRRKNVWKNEINDIIRGACGGFLFGIPLLYTMEVWWIGSLAKPSMIMLAIALMFLVVFLLNRTEGFRRSKRNSPPYGSLTDTIEAMGIGLVCSAFMLLLMQELTPETSMKEALGKIVFEGVPFTLGVALANQLLGDTRDGDGQGRIGDSTSDGSRRKPDELHATFADVGATLIGATVIAFNIAPTDEIPMLAAAVTPLWLLAIIATSILISYGVVFQAGFSDQQKRRQQQGIFQRPSSETIMAYLVSLVAAAFMLWFFQKVTFSDPWTIWLEYTLLLGLPASIGGAAGRLAV